MSYTDQGSPKLFFQEARSAKFCTFNIGSMDNYLQNPQARGEIYRPRPPDLWILWDLLIISLISCLGPYVFLHHSMSKTIWQWLTSRMLHDLEHPHSHSGTICCSWYTAGSACFGLLAPPRKSECTGHMARHHQGALAVALTLADYAFWSETWFLSAYLAAWGVALASSF